MSIFDIFIEKNKHKDIDTKAKPVYSHEFCPRCEANITLQKGYNNSLPYWVCRGCGEMLINPEVPGNIAWICDGCGEMLNIQDGFCEACGTWTCTMCGYGNKIDESELYLTEEEFQTDFNNAYKGLSDEEMLEILSYNEEAGIDNRDNIIIVRNMEDGRLYVKKILTVYDASVYRYLMEHSIDHMPKIYSVYEGNNSLIVIEEYLEGKTLLEILEDGLIEEDKAILILKSICHIAKRLHTLDVPIIHRDIKPSNVIINDEEVYLLDINAAKWYRQNEVEDTKLMGTQYYAAPEQLGYGFSSSSEKADIYAMGILLNVMITGKLPKEKRAPDAIWKIIKNCICLEPKDRYTDDELISALDKLLE